jgi:CheY-like chemotaxis protein
MTIGNQAVVLVIDDDEVIRDNFRSYLEDYSYQVIEAENGKNGLEIFGRERPDLVLLNLYLNAAHAMPNGGTLSFQTEDMIIDVGTRMIKSFGYKVLTVGGGKEAVELYKSNKIVEILAKG